VRDQRVRLQSDEALGLVVRALGRLEARGGEEAQQAAPIQFVASFTMDDWLVMRRVVGKRACLMRHRAPVQAPAAER
jgi:hypothetical protein